MPERSMTGMARETSRTLSKTPVGRAASQSNLSQRETINLASKFVSFGNRSAAGAGLAMMGG